MQFEILSGGRADYYKEKISQIEQDILGNESQVRTLFTDKSEYVKSWALCLEELHRLGVYTNPVDTICAHIINRLRDLGCTSGISTAYKALDNRFKNAERSELTKAGIHSDEGDVETSTIFSLEESSKNFLRLPHEVVSLETAPPEDMQENEEQLGKLVKEAKRRHQEYINMMNSRGIAFLGQKESDVEGTPRPYDPVKGFFFQEMMGLSDTYKDASDTCKDISDKIEHYPPETIKEDKLLAEGVAAWRTLIEWWNEHMRPYADLKFSQSYPDWFETQALNRDYGKHAAAVKSKVATLSGGYRGLTREQVGDKGLDLADKALHYKSMFDLANKAFELLQKNMPHWRKRRLDPSVGTRKENVGPKLSESAFGSDKDR